MLVRIYQTTHSLTSQNTTVKTKNVLNHTMCLFKLAFSLLANCVLVEVTPAKEECTFFLLCLSLAVLILQCPGVCATVCCCVQDSVAVCSWVQQWLYHSYDKAHNPETELNTVYLYQD
jgi:hypothetical protein